MSKKRTIIISGFPGVGKSHLSETYKGSILDSDSSKFSKVGFPANYINHIKQNMGLVDIICVSSHLEVRQALVKEGLPFILVYPNKEVKEEYIKRFENRGSNRGFIRLVSENWYLWLKQLNNQTGCSHLILDGNTYLSDIFV